VLRKIFVPNRDEKTGVWRKKYIVRKSVLFSHQILCRRQHERKGAEGLYEEEKDDRIK
jgi:hypothetical protein